jgi:hypothetical protein
MDEAKENDHVHYSINIPVERGLVSPRVVISDVLGGKDVVEGRDGRTDGRFCLLGIGRIL